MAQIISFGKYKKNQNIFQSLWSEISGLSTFTKLTIITIIAIVFALPRATTQIQTFFQYAAPPVVEESTALPSNCHLAVDLSTCRGTTCQPTPAVVCDTATK